VTGEVAKGPGWELRLGRWQDALADVESCDAVITDPPYSDRTHDAYEVNRDDAHDKRAGRRAIDYASWSPEDVAEMVAWASSAARGWVCAMHDHPLIGAYEQAMGAAGRYVFSPISIVTMGSTFRMGGDGPAQWAVMMTPSRPRSRAWLAARKAARDARGVLCALPGAYLSPPRPRGGLVGGKNLALMRAIIRDYSEPDDLIVDPCAGGGTTLLAAVIEGRRAIGAEMDPETFARAKARLGRGYDPDLFGGSR
jgi:site-specific DNA-methyltransferase (adenine-specific)